MCGGTGVAQLNRVGLRFSSTEEAHLQTYLIYIPLSWVDHSSFHITITPSKQAHRSAKNDFFILSTLTQYNNQPSSSPTINPLSASQRTASPPFTSLQHASFSKSQNQPRPPHEQVRVHESYLSSRLSANHPSNFPSVLPPSPLTHTHLPLPP